MRWRRPVTATAVPSGTARWTDLCDLLPVPADAAGRFGLTRGWHRDWTVEFRRGDLYRTVAVGDVPQADVFDGDPAITNTWHANRTSQAGLQYVASLAEHRPFASLFERDVLVALDFDRVDAVAAQPFLLRWHDGTRDRKHVPDFAAVLAGETWIINCRPAARVTPDAVDQMVALRQVCSENRWRYAFVVGYRHPAHTNVSTVAAHRETSDPLAYGPRMLDRLDSGPAAFGDLVAAFESPPIARAVLQRLVWDRRAVLDLGERLTDSTVVTAGADA